MKQWEEMKKPCSTRSVSEHNTLRVCAPSSFAGCGFWHAGQSTEMESRSRHSALRAEKIGCTCPAPAGHCAKNVALPPQSGNANQALLGEGLDSTFLSIMKKAMRTKARLKIMRKLYHKGKTGTKELGGKNYVYWKHEIPKLRRMGLVNTTRKFATYDDHELTNLGKTIFLLLSGEFKDITPDKNFSGVVQKEPAFIARQEEIKETLHNLEQKRDFLVLGEKGTGKTCFLNYLAKNHLQNAVFCKPKTPKTILIALAESFGMETKEKTQMQLFNEVKKALENSKETPLLIIDNAHTIPPRSVETLTELSRLGVVFLAAARYTPEHYEFKKSLRLKRLTKEESSKLARDLLEKSLGMAPEEIAEKCKEEKEEVGAEIGDSDPEDEKQKPEPEEGINEDMPVINIGKDFFLKLACLLLSIKFLLYMRKDYKTGYAFAMVAYLIFTMFKYWGKKRK